MIIVVIFFIHLLALSFFIHYKSEIKKTKPNRTQIEKNQAKPNRTGRFEAVFVLK
jgi:preprotein translocase subunit SecG